LALWGLTAEKGPTDTEAGLDVKEVFAGSAAASAGLRTGDRLLTLDDRWTDSLIDLYAAASYVKPGSEAILVIKRAGEEQKLSIRPEAGL
jgi:S1-C subfamily serine protease